MRHTAPAAADFRASRRGRALVHQVWRGRSRRLLDSVRGSPGVPRVGARVPPPFPAAQDLEVCGSSPRRRLTLRSPTLQLAQIDASYRIRGSEALRFDIDAHTPGPTPSSVAPAPLARR